MKRAHFTFSDDVDQIKNLAIQADPRRLEIRPIEQVDWLEANGNYVRIHVGSNIYGARASLSSLLSRLPDSTFVQTSRSSIVNIRGVREMVGTHRRKMVVLDCGAEVPVSEHFMEELRSALRLATGSSTVRD